MLIDIENILPYLPHILAFQRLGKKPADAYQVEVQVTRPDHRQFLDPAELFSKPGHRGPQFLKVPYNERRPLAIKLDCILISINVMAMHSKPLAVKGRKTHEPK